MPQGQCTLSADEIGRVLDRLAGLEHVIRPEQIQQALAATHRVDSRRCRLTHEVVLWIVLAMALFTDVPIRQVFKLSRRLRFGEHSPHRSSLCAARKRLGVAPVRYLFERVTRPLARPETPGAFAYGLRLVGLDSTVYDLPDSAANDAAFGRPRGGRGDGAFPQIRKLSLVELGTHAELGLVLKAHRCNERTMVAGLLKLLTPEMLLLLDKGFFSYELWRELDARRIKVLDRVTTQMVLRPIRELADGSYLAKLYKGDSNRKQDRDGIVVRVIRYTLNDPQRVGHGEEHVLITNLLDDAFCPAVDLIILYHERWEHENSHSQCPSLAEYRPVAPRHLPEVGQRTAQVPRPLGVPGHRPQQAPVAGLDRRTAQARHVGQDRRRPEHPVVGRLHRRPQRRRRRQAPREQRP